MKGRAGKRGSAHSAALAVWLLAFLSACAPDSHAAAPHRVRTRVPPLSLVSYVNPLVGTAGDGNVFPGASAPFGMLQWSPDTSAGGLSRPGGYAYGDRIIAGFSMTHLSGAGCAAYGNLSFMPTMRPTHVPPLPNGSPYSDRFVHQREVAAPGTYDVRLASGIAVRLTATPRSGLGVVSFPRSATGAVVLNVGAAAGGHLNTDGAMDASVTVAGSREVRGWVLAGHFCNLANSYRLYFDAVFNRPFVRVATWHGATLRAGARAERGPHCGAVLTFDTKRSRDVEMKIGLSYVGTGNAAANTAADNPGWNESTARRRSRALWDDLLTRISVSGGAASDRRVFYTALYHSLLHPNIFSDANGQYMGFDHRIHNAGRRAQYANFSGWDIYRCQIQLLAWLLPRRTGDMMQSLITDAEQGGWLPKWPVANEETGEMNGDSADPILTDAYSFGAHDFDASTALRFMVKGATQQGTGLHGYVERPGLRQYLQLGYIPGYNPEEIRPYGAAATTLEYAIDDFGIAQLARALGRRDQYSRFIRRSHTWQHLFDSATGLIEPRMSDGAFPGKFDVRSTDGYTEGNALQYTWMVPHDLPRLFHLMGGDARVQTRLDPLFVHLNGGPTDPYDWAGNEPGLGLPWEYDFAGRPWRTQAVVRRVMLNRYANTVGGLPGNDDLGALSSWYVWAALGMYPEIPGAGGLALASPLFPHISVHSEDGRFLKITSSAANRSHPYVISLRLNGRPYRRTWLPLTALNRSSSLSYDLSRTEQRRWMSGTGSLP